MSKQENKLKPLSAEFLLKRGFCCGFKCKNCPYHPKYTKGSKVKRL